MGLETRRAFWRRSTQEGESLAETRWYTSQADGGGGITAAMGPTHGTHAFRGAPMDSSDLASARRYVGVDWQPSVGIQWTRTDAA